MGLASPKRAETDPARGSGRLRGPRTLVSASPGCHQERELRRFWKEAGPRPGLPGYSLPPPAPRAAASGLRLPRGPAGSAGPSAPRLLAPRREQAGGSAGRRRLPHCGNASCTLGRRQPCALPYLGAPPSCGNWNCAAVPPSLLQPNLNLTGLFSLSKP